MKCDFNYCIYNRNFACILDEIRIDSLGMCESCESVTVPKKNLEKYKRKTLKEKEMIWKNFDKKTNKPDGK